MSIPLDNDWNDLPSKIENEMTDAGKATTTTKPKQVKGGVYAPADVKLIKNALVFYVQHNGCCTSEEETQAVNLIHRLDNRI